MRLALFALSLLLPLFWLLYALACAAARGDRLARAARRRALEPACVEGRLAELEPMPTRHDGGPK